MPLRMTIVFTLTGMRRCCFRNASSDGSPTTNGIEFGHQDRSFIMRGVTGSSPIGGTMRFTFFIKARKTLNLLDLVKQSSRLGRPSEWPPGGETASRSLSRPDKLTNNAFVKLGNGTARRGLEHPLLPVDGRRPHQHRGLAPCLY